MDDVREILSMPGGGGLTPYAGVGRKKKTAVEKAKKPEGMARELYALLSSDGATKAFNELPPLVPSQSLQGGYKEKVKLGPRVARPWKWTPFTNPARRDGAVFYHWRRAQDENKDYPFAKFNKEVPIHQYSESEYNNHLEQEGWNKQETDYLFDLCRRFDLRWPVIQDRWETEGRSIEDLKERYYFVTNALNKLRAEPGQDVKLISYDGDLERVRKTQMDRLWKRTPEQVEEEEFLRAELRKIDMRVKERDKKTRDLQRLITAADGASVNTPETPSATATPLNKKVGEIKKAKKKQNLVGRKDSFTISGGEIFSAIKWPEMKNGGVATRSSKMKLPSSVGARKSKVIEQVLQQLAVDPLPPASAQVCSEFNELRGDIVLLWELRAALGGSEAELTGLVNQAEGLGLKLEMPDIEPSGELNVELADAPRGPATPAIVSLAGIEFQHQQHKKRKAAIEQANVLRKLKHKV